MKIEDLSIGDVVDIKFRDYMYRGVKITWKAKNNSSGVFRTDKGQERIFNYSNSEVFPHNSKKSEIVKEMMSEIDFSFFQQTGGTQANTGSEISRHPKDFIQMALEKWMEKGYVKED